MRKMWNLSFWGIFNSFKRINFDCIHFLHVTQWHSFILLYDWKGIYRVCRDHISLCCDNHTSISPICGLGVSRGKYPGEARLGFLVFETLPFWLLQWLDQFTLGPPLDRGSSLSTSPPAFTVFCVSNNHHRQAAVPASALPGHKLHPILSTSTRLLLFPP